MSWNADTTGRVAYLESAQEQFPNSHPLVNPRNGITISYWVNYKSYVGNGFSFAIYNATRIGILCFFSKTIIL